MTNHLQGREFIERATTVTKSHQLLTHTDDSLLAQTHFVKVE